MVLALCLQPLVRFNFPLRLIHCWTFDVFVRRQKQGGRKADEQHAGRAISALSDITKDQFPEPCD